MTLTHYMKYLFYLSIIIACSQAKSGSYEDFFKAVELNDAGTVRALFIRGFDPNTRDPNGNVGLYLALRAEAWRSAEAIFEYTGTDIDAPNQVGETPLMMAALRGQLEWCRRLVARGAKVNRDGWTPLHYAAAGPSDELTRWFVEQRAAIDARSPNGSTPLMLASAYGSIDGATTLLARGANSKLRDSRGMTAADFARGAGRDRLAQQLDAATR